MLLLVEQFWMFWIHIYFLELVIVQNHRFIIIFFYCRCSFKFFINWSAISVIGISSLHRASDSFGRLVEERGVEMHPCPTMLHLQQRGRVLYIRECMWRAREVFWDQQTSNACGQWSWNSQWGALWPYVNPGNCTTSYSLSLQTASGQEIWVIILFLSLRNCNIFKNLYLDRHFSPGWCFIKLLVS